MACGEGQLQLAFDAIRQQLFHFAQIQLGRHHVAGTKVTVARLQAVEHRVGLYQHFAQVFVE
ncbi:hypothetical protein D3C77_816290 [compost metagenome]